jgi:hypothetical protein
MDNQNEINREVLFSRFGLCPDYKVMIVEGEWVEFYAPPEMLPLWDNSSTPYVENTRLHLDTHLVETDRGITLSARFAVSHTNKMIFLQVSTTGEFGEIMETYK